jgi:hypothetical protein
MFGLIKSVINQHHRKDYIFDHYLRVEYKSDIQAAKKMGLTDVLETLKKECLCLRKSIISLNLQIL